MLLAFASGSSLFWWIGFGVICLMLRSVAQSSAVSALAQEQLGKQMLKVSDLEAKDWHCQVCVFKHHFSLTQTLRKYSAPLIKMHKGSLSLFKVSISSTHSFFSTPYFSADFVQKDLISKLAKTHI